MIRGVQADELWDVWPHVAVYFKSFEDRAGGDLTAGQLLEQIVKKTRQMWVAIIDGKVKACALTQVMDPPAETVVLDFCAGEGREDWRDDMVAEIEAWARHLGKRRVRIICRPGWAREIKGYRETHRVIEKDLPNV